MNARRAVAASRRAREFEEFVTGAAGRLLHVANLLTAEPPGADPRARRLVTEALAHTYARWDRLRGEDPYSLAREELITRFARGQRLWTHRFRGRGRAGGCPDPDGVLRILTARERLIVVLRLYESVGDEQTAALAGLPVEQVRLISRRAVARLCADAGTGPGPMAGPVAGPAAGPGPVAEAGR
ncbi:sigma factor-like helix-turn-helix DNA-binding protein [Streptomyces yaizuensis]|uniref:RNA polymerase n=1 Tax=Streptomyces yaizuensis TaxID=2989713 RepID=A0ABQ5NVC9_9ACTN|nr:sigma factor-like helix-turn-helix DNA-binding protein [Streptomyces sp. YSPA8]GLF94319.1 RNA polymerase [Streptomyces sp. YSPA8]